MLLKCIFAVLENTKLIHFRALVAQFSSETLAVADSNLKTQITNVIAYILPGKNGRKPFKL